MLINLPTSVQNLKKNVTSLIQVRCKCLKSCFFLGVSNVQKSWPYSPNWMHKWILPRLSAQDRGTPQSDSHHQSTPHGVGGDTPFILATVATVTTPQRDSADGSLIRPWYLSWCELYQFMLQGEQKTFRENIVYEHSIGRTGHKVYFKRKVEESSAL